MKIYPCGIIVQMKLNKTYSMITAASIRFESVQYELTYFHNGEVKTVWCNEKEFEHQLNCKEDIGFKS